MRETWLDTALFWLNKLAEDVVETKPEVPLQVSRREMDSGNVVEDDGVIVFELIVDDLGISVYCCWYVML